MMKNKTSIIIPAYNIEDYLGAAVDSVLAQTYCNIEVIIVDDGSADQTGAIADAYAAMDSRVRVIHQKNAGVTAARLRGVAETTGDWVGFVDGDDVIEPEMYERLLNNALNHGADISHCGYQMVFPDGRVTHYYNTGVLEQQDGATAMKELLSGKRIEPSLGNKLYRKSLFHSLLQDKIMDMTTKYNEDLLMNYWLFKAADVAVYEDFCPYHYMLRKGSATTAVLNSDKLCDPLRVVHRIYDDLEDKSLILPRLIRLLVSGASMTARRQQILVVPFRDLCRKELRQRLKEIFKCEACGGKLKAMALWAAVWPKSYGVVHRIYARLTGVDKKYDLG